jgi:hypothetical protein
VFCGDLIHTNTTESVKELRLWTWYKIGFSDLLLLLSRFQTPLNPNSKDPGKFSIHAIMSMQHSQWPSNV